MGGNIFCGCASLKQAVLCGLAAAALLLTVGFATAPAATGSAATPAPSTPARMTEESIIRSIPEGLVQDIDLYQGGGVYPGCMSVPELPELDYMPGDLELMDIAMISTCGWQPDEKIKVTLREPTGKLQNIEVKAVPSKNFPTAYEATLFYQPPIDAPEGIYRFTFEGSQGVVKAKVKFNRPKGARLFVLSDNPFQPAFRADGTRQKLMLAGFFPEEPVKLMAYRFEGTHIQFYGLQDYVTDRLGRLVVQVDLPKSGAGAGADGKPAVQMDFYAYGRDTRFVALERFTADGFSASDAFKMDLYCPGASAPRVRSQSSARAAPPAGTKLQIVQVPGFGSRVTVEVPANTELYIFGQPKCIDHAFWWQVALREPVRFGWAAESGQGKYRLEPVPAK